MPRIQSIAGRIARRFGLRLQPIYPADMTPDERAVWTEVSPYTMTSMERILAFIRAVRFALESDIPGDIVECGVWRGGSMMAAAHTILGAQASPRHLHLFDTFSGMPPPSRRDVRHDGATATDLLATAARTDENWAIATLDDVKCNMTSTKYPSAYVHFTEGKVEETIPTFAPHKIAILRLDTDWYESTRHELIHLFPRVAPGGIVIIDDYGHWGGARKAVDEFCATLTPSPFLHRIDYTARAFTKSVWDRSDHEQS